MTVSFVSRTNYSQRFSTEVEKEESIYNLIPKTCTMKDKPTRHRSKFRRLVQEELKRNRAPCKTLGPTKVQTRPPDRFLKKHEKAPKVPEKKIFNYPDAERNRPPVPKPDERPVIGLKTTKNLITCNALANIHSAPKVPQRNVVDTRHGDKMLLEPSGLEPKYLHKKDYGRNPDYLERRRRDTKKAQDEYDSYVSEHFRKQSMRKLEPEERESLLAGLKENWEQVHHDFLMLSVIVDTPGKMEHKERMELELKQLEKDCELLETHKTIYVVN